MKNFVESGELVTVTSPAAGTTSGYGVLIGTYLFGVATKTTTVGQDVAILVSGVVDLLKVVALEVNVGDRLWWVVGTGFVSNVNGGNVNVGVAVSYAAANTDTTVKVLLKPTPVLAG